MNIESNLALDIRGLSKVYRTYAKPSHRLKEILSAGGRQYYREVRALDDVSLSLEKGGRLGIIGENGSGKSTLLKVIAGVLTPTTGTAFVDGRVSALLELGAGFNPELSGRENIAQFCLLHGMSRDEAREAAPDIIRFSELKDAIDHPVKTYSSGMGVRLGFACAVHVKPDILIVDEALSVGDAYFQNKCLHKIKSMLDDGTAFIYVTHAADSVRALCNQGIWLEKGRMRMQGSATEIGAAYQSEVFSRMARAGIDASLPETETHTETSVQSQGGAGTDVAVNPKPHPARFEAFSERVAGLRTGSGEILIDDITVVDEKGVETDAIEFGRPIRIRVFFHVQGRSPEGCVLSVGVTDASGRQILHLNPMFAGLYASDAPPHVVHVMDFTFENPLCPGEYGVQAGIGTLDMHPVNKGQTVVNKVVDYCAGGSRFSVMFPTEQVKRDLWGVVHVDCKVDMRAVD